jgi:hypothetical protein
MTQGNRNYAALLRGATAADFLRNRSSSGSSNSFTDSAVEFRAAFGAPGALDPGLVTWASTNLETTYAGLSGLDRFFAAPAEAGPAAGEQDRLLHRLGRHP